jgi:hypothetical protein
VKGLIMATVSPGFDFVQAQAAKVPRVTWTGLATGDTIEALPVNAQAAIAGAVQFKGTFGGATVGLQASNDGVTFSGIKDLGGTVISTTSGALFEFTTAAMYIRPVISGGTGDAVDVVVVLRG